jgi:hypothetical protein
MRTSVDEQIPVLRFPSAEAPEAARGDKLSLGEHLRVPMMTRRDIAVILYCLAVTDSVPAHLQNRRDELIAALQEHDLCPVGVFKRVVVHAE